MLASNRVEDCKMIAIAFERCVDDPSTVRAFILAIVDAHEGLILASDVALCSSIIASVRPDYSDDFNDKCEAFNKNVR